MARMVRAKMPAPPSFRSSRSTEVMTACLRPSSATESARVEATPSCSQPNATGRPLLEPFLHRAQKLARHHPVDDPVVEAETHVHHVAHRDRVLDHNSALDD